MDICLLMDKTEYSCDVAIIGAGPAGSTLAYFLVQKGFKAILLDKEIFPRNKVCAGGLPVKVLNILPFDIGSVIEREIYEVTLTYKLKKAFSKDYVKPLLYMVNRERFDNLLVQEARNVGANFLEGQKIEMLSLNGSVWTIRTSENIIKAQILVGADGANSFVAKELSLKPSNHFHVGLHSEVPISLFKQPKCLERGIVLDWGMHKDCYGWIFPKQKIASVGVHGPVKLGKQLKKYLDDLLESYGISPQDQKITGHLISHRTRESSISKSRALLVGDAAGSVDYWTGEGIYYAISSAQIAASQIMKFLDGQTKSLSSYTDAINEKIMPEIKTSYEFSKVFNCLSSLAFTILRKYIYPWDVFCRIMRGDRTFLEMKRRFRPDIMLRKLFFKSQRGKYE